MTVLGEVLPFLRNDLMQRAMEAAKKLPVVPCKCECHFPGFKRGGAEGCPECGCVEDV